MTPDRVAEALQPRITFRQVMGMLSTCNRCGAVVSGKDGQDSHIGWHRELWQSLKAKS